MTDYRVSCLEIKLLSFVSQFVRELPLDFFIAWAKAWPNFPGGNLVFLAQLISPSLLEFNKSSGFNHHGDDAYAQCLAST